MKYFSPTARVAEDKEKINIIKALCNKRGDDLSFIENYD
jgi:hypothetical protein